MTKSIKAVRIDPTARLISFVVLAVEPTPGWAEPISAELACADVARMSIDPQRSVWFNDALLYHPWAQQAFFAINGDTIAGTALVINHDSDGVPCNVDMTLKSLRARVTWIEPKDVRIAAPAITYEKDGKVVTEYLSGQPFFTFDHQPGGEPASSTTPSGDPVKGLTLVEAAHDGGGQHDFSLLPNEGSLDSVHMLNHGDPKQWPGVVYASKRQPITAAGRKRGNHSAAIHSAGGIKGERVPGFYPKVAGNPAVLPAGLLGERYESRMIDAWDKRNAAAVRGMYAPESLPEARKQSAQNRQAGGDEVRQQVREAVRSISNDNPRLWKIKAVMRLVRGKKQSIIGRYIKQLKDEFKVTGRV